MSKQKVAGSSAGKRIGASTAADVRAFKKANSAILKRVTASKQSAASYVRTLETISGVRAPKKG